MAVLVGNFGAIGTVGIEAMLEAQGIALETTTRPADDESTYVIPAETRVVVLDRGLPRALERAERLAAEYAGLRVIVCSLDETTMLVYTGRDSAPYEAPLDPPRLAAAIRERR